MKAGKNNGRSLGRTALWLATLGLFLASGGIDGVYLMAWMPVGWGWLGLVLNVVVDLTSELVMYWYGRLRLMPINTKRYKQAKWLLLFEGGLMGFQWLFSWLQLRTVLESEPAWVAVISAAFVPFALVTVGYTQALLAGKWDVPSTTGPSKASAAEEPAPKPTKMAVLETKPAVPGPELVACKQCGRQFGTKQALNAHRRWCKEASE